MASVAFWVDGIFRILMIVYRFAGPVYKKEVERVMNDPKVLSCTLRIYQQKSCNAMRNLKNQSIGKAIKNQNLNLLKNTAMNLETNL